MRSEALAYTVYIRVTAVGALLALLFVAWSLQHVYSGTAIILGAAAILGSWGLAAIALRQLIRATATRSRTEVRDSSEYAAALLQDVSASMRSGSK